MYYGEVSEFCSQVICDYCITVSIKIGKIDNIFEFALHRIQSHNIISIRKIIILRSNILFPIFLKEGEMVFQNFTAMELADDKKF